MNKAPAIETYLDDLVATLRKNVPLALRKWDEDAIHDARVATRRMKAALDALAPLFPARLLKSFNRTTRQIRRRLGPLRDIDVLLGHLKEMERAATLGRACAWMREHLLTEREAMRQECQQKASSAKLLAELGRWWGLRDAASDLGRAAPPLLLAALPTRIDDFVRRAEHLQAAHTTPDHAGSKPAGDPHAVRIAGKALRYTLELTASAGLGPPSRVLRRFKDLQDALGLWHDFAVLSQRTMLAAIQTEIPYHNPAMYSQLLVLSRAAWQRAERRLGHFVAIWRETGPAVLADISALLPPPPANPTPEPQPALEPTPAPVSTEGVTT